MADWRIDPEPDEPMSWGDILTTVLLFLAVTAFLTFAFAPILIPFLAQF